MAVSNCLPVQHRKRNFPLFFSFGSGVISVLLDGLDPVLHPGRRWMSLSKDGGRKWSAVSDLRYDTGEHLYAPATLAKFIRSRKTGKLYWIGNISREPAKGNLPR